MTQDLPAQIVLIKWEQNRIVLETYINNDYIKYKVYEVFIKFNTEQAKNTKIIERRETSFTTDWVKNADFYKIDLKTIMATHK